MGLRLDFAESSALIGLILVILGGLWIFFAFKFEDKDKALSIVLVIFGPSFLIIGFIIELFALPAVFWFVLTDFAADAAWT